MRSLEWFLGRVWDARAWRPEHARVLWSQIVHRSRNRDAGFTDHDHLVAAARWLTRAQDVMGDGGVGGRYRLAGGWTSSYPETTGYIVPTFLSLARELADHQLEDRARQCVEFLLRLQLVDGAFPAGEVHENTTRSSVFNTAQILSGLGAWHEMSGDGRVLEAARRAADWLVAQQDTDGAWRRHVYEGVPTTYSAHASCWLAEFGARTGAASYLDAAARHLGWVLQHRDAQTGWFDLAGFSVADHRARRAVTHSIAYTLWGVLRTSEVLGRKDGIAAVEAAAIGIARRLELSGWLPGVLDHRWRGCAPYACLTGNAQMVVIWLRLYRHDGNPVFLNAALKALDLISCAQPMFSRDPNIQGGIPGSDPVWGDYLYNAFPNWAAKFFIDAVLEKRRVLGNLETRPRSRWEVPADVPRMLPDLAGHEGPPLRVVMYSGPSSHKVPQMLSRWSDWGFRPTAVVFEGGITPHYAKRIFSSIRESGLQGVVSRVFARMRSGARAESAADPAPVDPIAYCRNHGIPCFEVTTLDSPKSRALLESLRPDLAIHAGAGILRAGVLALARLGTLNAHMGVLPYYRGMNVAEWARFDGDPVGCTVHLIDPGIDTGSILCVRVVDAGTAMNIRELRRLVDDAQIALLGEVARFVIRTGSLPPARRQRPDEGRQFFRMHREIARVLEGELHRAVGAT